MVELVVQPLLYLQGNKLRKHTNVFSSGKQCQHDQSQRSHGHKKCGEKLVPGVPLSLDPHLRLHMMGLLPLPLQQLPCAKLAGYGQLLLPLQGAH